MSLTSLKVLKVLKAFSKYISILVEGEDPGDDAGIFHFIAGI